VYVASNTGATTIKTGEHGADIADIIKDFAVREGGKNIPVKFGLRMGSRRVPR